MSRSNWPNLLSNSGNCVVNAAPLGKSHHCCLIFDYNCYSHQSHSTKTELNLKKANYDRLRTELRRFDFANLKHLPVEEAWTYLHNAIMDAANKWIPKISFDPLRKKRPPWIDTAALEKVRSKKAAYKTYRRTKRPEEYLNYCQARNQARWATRKALRSFEKSLAEDAKRNTKSVFKYVNSKLKTKSTIPELCTEDGMKTSDIEKANALNEFFASVFTSENPTVPEPEVVLENSIQDLDISQTAVERKLKKLKIDKSPGPDCLHPRVLKELAEVISSPITDLMQISLNSGILPSGWKDGHITAIHKKGNKSSPDNYRPVSLTSQICKLMESVIRDHIMDFFTGNNIISESQHGFVPGRSCSTQLLECLDRWTNALDQGKSADVVYLDFSKAFDSVPHQPLIRKLHALGIRGKILDWCESFLVGRRQRVVVNGSVSKWEPVKSGVPQGSVLGPLMFVVYINDMPEVASSIMKLFADDAKLYRDVDTPHDIEQLKEDLNRVTQWSDRWQMTFNAKKCQVLHLGSRNQKTQYQMLDQTIASAEVVKDLGVHIDSKLSFHQHTEAKVNKANRALGILRRSFDYLDNRTFSLLYKALVRPHLEYCHAVTYPRTAGQMKSIESVQRRATKCLRHLHDLPYEERLKTLRLPSMTYRLMRGDMIEMYKYTHQLYQVQPKMINITHLESATRGHSLKLVKPRCSSTLRQKTFPHRAIDRWNSLPEDIVSAPSTNSFKSRFDEYCATETYVC